MQFIKRLSAPESSDRRFLSPEFGGCNPCIVRDKATGSVLPNCVGYAYGRFMEIMGADACNLSTGNAENWYGFTADGYQRGMEPRAGAVACWRKGEAYNGTDGAGHVAVVEEVLPGGDILCSNSDYYGRRFYTSVYRKSSGYSLGAAYTFQGFIYCPEELPEPAERDPSLRQIEVVADGLRVRQRPELASPVRGTAGKGFYTVLESRDMRHEASNGYLWYRVGEDCWVASKEGEWTRLHEPSAADGEIRHLKKIIAEAMEVLGRA